MIETKEVRQSAGEAVVLWEGWRTDIGLAVVLSGVVEVEEEGYLLLWWREEEGLSVVRAVNDCIFAVLGGCFKKPED